MARVAGVNIPDRKHTVVALTSIYGIGGSSAKEICKEIRLFEVASATDFGHPALFGNFTPNLFISIKNEWNYKEKALKAYEEEIRPYPHSRSLTGISNLI